MNEVERILYLNCRIVTRRPNWLEKENAGVLSPAFVKQLRKLQALAALRVLHFAVIPAVGEIDDQADNKPDNEPRPVDPAQLVHHVAVKADTQEGNDGHPRSTERPGLLGIGIAQDHHRDADDDKRQ